MSNKNNESKQYQLWVWYSTQDAQRPQNGYTLLLETDSPAELYLTAAKLHKDDKYYTTQNVTLRVQAI